MLLKQSRHAICCHVAPLQNPPSKNRRVYSVLHLLFVVVQTFTLCQRLVFFVRVLKLTNSISLILVSLSLSLCFCFLFICSNFEFNYTHKNFPPTNTKTLLNTSSRILLLRSATDSVLIKTNMLSGFWLRFLYYYYYYYYIFWSDKRCKFNMSGPLDRFARPCEYSYSCSFIWYLFSSKILVLIFLICSSNSWILFDCL